MKSIRPGSIVSKAFWTLHAIARRIPGIFAQHGLVTCHSSHFADTFAFRRAKHAASMTGTSVEIDWQLHTILWAAEHALRLGGCIVECGTNCGYRMRAIAELHSCAVIYCFDTWKGFDPRYPSTNPQVADHYDWVAWQRVQETFRAFPCVHLHRGTVPDSLVHVPKIGLLHIDMNCVEPEVAALAFFWPDLLPGALVISDDYCHVGYEAQRFAWDEVARKLGREVLSLPTGQGIIIK